MRAIKLIGGGAGGVGGVGNLKWIISISERLEKFDRGLFQEQTRRPVNTHQGKGTAEDTTARPRVTGPKLA